MQVQQHFIVIHTIINEMNATQYITYDTLEENQKQQTHYTHDKTRIIILNTQDNI